LPNATEMALESIFAVLGVLVFAAESGSRRKSRGPSARDGLIFGVVERIRGELPRILEGLSAIAVGTRDAALGPACVQAVGVTADASGRVTVFIPEATGERTFANLAANGAVAVVMEKILTHRTVQVKGRCVGLRPASEDEREIVERCMGAFFDDVVSAGAPRRVLTRKNRWPCRAVTLEVAEVYEQTPGPRAGLPLSAGGPA